MPNGLAITYLGWSGFRIDLATGPVFVDPPAQADIAPGEQPLVLLSHGHPEHLSGIRGHIQRNGPQADAIVLASQAVCDHLIKSSPSSAMTFMPVRPGDCFGLAADLSIRVFEWTHLPLLPGGFARNIRHAAQLASRPGLAMKIALAGLSGPTAGPMIGFRINFGRRQVIAYGEGLHRFCDPEDAGGSPKLVVALAGVEPGDEAAMPDLLRACGAGRAILFEPHAKWRDAFGMPRVDLTALCDRLGAIGIDARVLVPKSRFVLDPDAEPSGGKEVQDCIPG